MVQERLAQNPHTPLRLSELRYLRRHAGLLNNTIVLNSVGASALSAKGAAFLHFTRHIDDLLNRVSIDDPEGLRRHYANPNVRTNLDSIGRRMPDLRCNAAEIAASEMPDGQENYVAVFFRKVVVNLFSMKPSFILMGIIGVVSISVYYYRPNRPNESRRLKRLFVQYMATYRVDNHIESGTILDINAKGAKLKHGHVGQLTPGSTVEILVSDDWVPSFVSWSNYRNSGITFENPLNSRQVQHIQKGSAGTRQAA